MIRKRIIAGLSLLLLWGGAGCKKNTSVANLPDGAGQAERAVRTAPVVSDVSDEAIVATGTTAPSSSTKIMPLVPGIIKKLPVQEGDPIKRGQILAMIDQSSYRLSMRQAQAAMEAAKIALDATTREKQRFEKLMQQDATARAQLDQVMDKFRGAQVQMKQALVARDMARKALRDTVLRAPYNGIVVKKVASLGDYAASMPPTVIVMIMDISTIELKIALPEPELQRVEVGVPIVATFNSIQHTLTTKISRIIRTVDPFTRSFTVIAEIPNAEMTLRPGLFGDVKISTSKPRRRLLVPTAALVDEGNGIFSVMVAQGGVARRKEITVATAGSQLSEALEGLSGDEQIILDSGGVRDGDVITTREAATPPRGTVEAKTKATTNVETTAEVVK